MRHAPSLDLIRRELRAQVCRRCYLRPPHSKWLGPGQPRDCESRCAIFVTLPRAHRIGEYLDPMVEPYERALRHLYQPICHEPSTDPAHEQACDRRALRRYEERVVELISALFNRTA